jgi:hypothetical protein
MEEQKISINKLANDGLNWITYQDHMLWAIKDHSWSEHLTTAAVTTAYMIVGEVGGLDPDTCWNWHEASMKQLITPQTECFHTPDQDECHT